MAGATIWKGIIHFGEANVPVKLHTAVSEERVQFHLIHRRDQVRVRQQMFCALEKRPVPAEEQIKGFEVEEGKYLLVDAGELEQAAPDSGRTIEVHEFVRTEQIDPLFLGRVYYLEPDVHAQGYTSFAEALQELGVSGICTWTMRKRAYLGALQARGGVVRLSTLRYADEVVAVESLDLQDIALSEKELKVGSDLIDQLTAPFEPQKYENEHEKKLRRIIEMKARGETIEIKPPKRLAPTAPDRLLEALEASLKKAA